MTEFCSHFVYQNFQFPQADELSPFHAELHRTYPEALMYAIKLASFQNGYGYFFRENDYQTLGVNLLYSLAIYVANKCRLVGLLGQY